mgnify:CR=1 FL=1
MQLRYGILGTSSIAPRFIAAVRAAGTGEIVAVSSRSVQKAQEKAQQWNIPTAYGSYDALLADDNVNTVYISTVNSEHYTWAKAAILRHKHVICEKPCTTTAQQTAELYDLARQEGVFFMEAQKMLFLPAILEVRRRIEAGVLGTVHMAQLSHSFPASYNGWMFDLSLGGGTLLSSGIYAVQLLIWLFGDIRSISGIKTTVETGAECQYILTGETQCGVQFTCKNSTLAVLDNTARLYGEKGWVELPEYWKARKAIFHIAGQEPEVVEFPCEHELVYEAEHIASCLSAGLLNSPTVTKDLSVKGISALEQVKEKW